MGAAITNLHSLADAVDAAKTTAHEGDGKVKVDRVARDAADAALHAAILGTKDIVMGLYEVAADFDGAATVATHHHMGHSAAPAAPTAPTPTGGAVPKV